MSDLIPLRKRGTWQGLQSITFALGSSAGAPIGGLLTDTIGWRWSFGIQVPISLLAILTVSLALRLPPPSSGKATAASNGERPASSTFWQKVKRIDFLGAITLTSATTTLLLFLDAGAESTTTTTGWTTPYALTCFGLSLLFSFLFLLTEFRFSAEPFAPRAILTHPSLLANYVVNFGSTASMMAMTFQLPMYLQAVQNFSPATVGLWMIPGVVGGVGGSIIGGAGVQRTGKYWGVLVGGYVGMLAGTVGVVLGCGVIGFSAIAVLGCKCSLFCMSRLCSMLTFSLYVQRS